MKEDRRKNKVIVCPRCKGKGYVEEDDIIGFNKQNVWAPGECAYCEAKGIIRKNQIENIDLLSDIFSENKAKKLGLIDIVKNTENKVYKLDSFSQFISFFEEWVCEHFIFRGVSDSKYALLTKVGRSLKDVTDKSEFLIREETILELFKSKATAHTGFQQLSEWQWIVLAQHYGLSTRLLDWTENPLVALYFAGENINKEGAIYLWHFSKSLHLSDDDPLEIIDGGFFTPPYLTNRIISQSSIFSISSRPWLELQDDFECAIKKIIITKNFKKELKSLLPRLGISRRTIFADLDSYANDIDQIYSTRQCKSGKTFTVNQK